MAYLITMRPLMKRLIIAALLITGGLFAFSQTAKTDVVITPAFKPSITIQEKRPEGYPSMVVAGGCFWCVESEFRRIEGVLYTRSGYAGGKEANPTYEQVSSHETGHREAVEIIFDPDKVSYRDLLDYFMTQAHDPTQEDGQGPDIGFQYTSAIYCKDDDQRKIAEDLIAQYEKEKKFKKPIATKIEPFSTFYSAEEYHQQYFEKYEKKTGQPHMTLWLKQQKENALKLIGQ